MRKHNVFKWGDEIIYGFAALIIYCRPLCYLKFIILLITTYRVYHDIMTWIKVKSYYNKIIKPISMLLVVEPITNNSNMSSKMLNIQTKLVFSGLFLTEKST